MAEVVREQREVKTKTKWYQWDELVSRGAVASAKSRAELYTPSVKTRINRDGQTEWKIKWMPRK